MTGILEANFDGLIGPTHNYAGLSPGNLASERNVGEPSMPRDAALQGLRKAKHLADLGLAQGVLPPQERPHLDAIRRLGFEGSDEELLTRVGREAPELLAAVSSASSMWAANAATVSPSADAADGRVHFTPANLRTTFHRCIEPEGTARALRAIFADPGRFVHHEPLPQGGGFGDEGAANHTRLVGADGRGLEVFVYGVSTGDPAAGPHRYPARQSLQASQAIARLHRLAPARALFLRQAAAVIDQGVFHNDVIAVGHGGVLLHHEEAFEDGPAAIARIRDALGEGLCAIEVRSSEVDVPEVVSSYLFNSQLVTLPGGAMALIAPVECRERDASRAVIERIVAGANPIASVEYLDVRQSMQNGGGPACLRLRVPLTRSELDAVHPACLLTDGLYGQLVDWVERHYRPVLSPADLADPALLEESRRALDELTGLLDLGSDFYPFQRA